MKKTINGYTLNHKDGEIVITKAFEKKANSIDNKEFKVLVTLRKAFPDYDIVQKVIAKNNGKTTYAKLTYATMIAYMEEQGVWEKTKGEFEHIKALANLHSGSYGHMKKWFLAKFPEFKTVLPLEQAAPTNTENKAASSSIAPPPAAYN
jgi:hypothetical protein